MELCACDWNPAVYGFTLSNYENNNIMVKWVGDDHVEISDLRGRDSGKTWTLHQ